MTGRVLITSRSFGQMSDEPLQVLKSAGFTVDMMGTDFDQAKFEQALPEYDALIIGAHPLTPQCLRRCDKLKIICKHGVGLDNLPLETARELDIRVTNTPHTNAQAVADLTLGLMLACARRIVFAAGALKDGQMKPVIGTDVYGKTLGLLGFGHIAKNVAQRAQGFSMKIMAYDPYIRQEEIAQAFPYVTMRPLDEVVAHCDFLSLHLPLAEETRGMIGSERLSAMKKEAYLINTSRGGIVDESALYEAVRAKVIAGAALDVTEQEPLPPTHPLLTLSEVIVTNHIGMYSKEAVTAVSTICAKNVVAMFTNASLANVVV